MAKNAKRHFDPVGLRLVTCEKFRRVMERKLVYHRWKREGKEAGRDC